MHTGAPGFVDSKRDSFVRYIAGFCLLQFKYDFEGLYFPWREANSSPAMDRVVSHIISSQPIVTLSQSVVNPMCAVFNVNQR